MPHFRGCVRYELYQPLRELWAQQVAALLQSSTARTAAAALLADVVWQGADVVITECVNKNQVGASCCFHGGGSVHRGCSV